MVPAIARALGIRETGGDGMLESVNTFLAGKALLLLLDNFEQILPAASQVAQLLATCSELQILVTSPAPLRVYGEHEYPVPPMAVAEPQQIQLRDLLQCETVRLFIERAQAVNPDFRATSENAWAVAEICRRLDGLPLAIELAAARVRVLTPDVLLQRLERRLPLLTQHSADVPQRQQTLRGAIAWSYDLLSASE